MRLVGSNSNAWTSGCGVNCAATASSSANEAPPVPRYCGRWASRRRRPAKWAVRAKGRGVWPVARRFTAPCRPGGFASRDSYLCSLNMTRYTIKRNRRIRQVCTVVWEDGAVRPLLPDPPDVNQELFLIGWLLHRDVLDQQSQHPLPVLRL